MDGDVPCALVFAKTSSFSGPWAGLCYGMEEGEWGLDSEAFFFFKVDFVF